MRPTRARLHEDTYIPDDASTPDLKARETARVRQNLSHQKLDKFIAAALAELNDDERAA